MRADPPEPPPERRAARRVWRRMAEVYGHRWTAQYGPESGPALATWARALAAFGADGVERGLARVLREGGPWPPTLPEFRELCRARPADFGLPAPLAALEEAARAARADPTRPWSHPAVGLAARAAALPHASALERERVFLRAYRLLTERVLAGRPLAPVGPAELGPLPEPPARGAEARRHLADLRAAVGLGGRGR